MPTAYCSWCARRAAHRLEKRHTLRRNVYRCSRCGGRTLRCRFCGSMARGRSGYDEELCAQHDGTIPGFDALPRSLAALDDCVAPPPRTRWAGHALTAAAAAAGAILTGGSPVGALLGGWTAARAARAYLGPIRDFGIERVRGGRGAPVLFVDGFLTQETSMDAWAEGLEPAFASRPWYRVTWESQNLRKLGTAVAEAAGSFRLPARRSLFLLLDVLRNPWHLALWKAERTGRLLGFLLSRLRLPSVVLLGHSLGARVVFEALQTMGARGVRKVEAAHLFGAAVDRGDRGGWALARRGAKRIVNYFSRHDGVLRYLYVPGNLFLSDPAGLRAVEMRGVRNIDAGSLVDGHTRYAEALPELLS